MVWEIPIALRIASCGGRKTIIAARGYYNTHAHWKYRFVASVLQHTFLANKDWTQNSHRGLHHTCVSSHENVGAHALKVIGHFAKRSPKK